MGLTEGLNSQGFLATIDPHLGVHDVWVCSSVGADRPTPNVAYGRAIPVTVDRENAIHVAEFPDRRRRRRLITAPPAGVTEEPL